MNFGYVNNLNCAETHHPRKPLMMGFGAGNPSQKLLPEPAPLPILRAQLFAAGDV